MSTNLQYSLRLKRGTDTIKDLVTDFQLVCLEVPMAITATAKELTSTNFGGEHGEEVYFPNELVFEAYDWKLKMGCTGNSSTACATIINAFIDYLRGGIIAGEPDGLGTKLSIASAYTRIGRQGCYLKEISEPEFGKDSSGNECAMFEITFRITDPVTLITL